MAETPTHRESGHAAALVSRCIEAQRSDPAQVQRSRRAPIASRPNEDGSVSSTTGRLGEAVTKVFMLFRTGAAHWAGAMAGTSRIAEAGFKGAVCDAAPYSGELLPVSGTGGLVGLWPMEPRPDQPCAFYLPPSKGAATFPHLF